MVADPPVPPAVRERAGAGHLVLAEAARPARRVDGERRLDERAQPPDWWLTKDGDAACLALYERHYSAYRYADGRKRVLFIGPGEKWPFRTWAGDAVFVWRVFLDDCIDERTGQRQDGINCAAFRNESTARSSDLIVQADAIADCLWPHRRHYTYVDPEELRSTNPGYCFLCAGWERCGRTKGGLLILERRPCRTGLTLLLDATRGSGGSTPVDGTVRQSCMNVRIIEHGQPQRTELHGGVVRVESDGELCLTLLKKDGGRVVYAMRAVAEILLDDLPGDWF